MLFGHNFSEGRREFRLGGLPAPLLAETPTEVILRDPHPVAGMRMVESEGQAATLRFATVDIQLQPVSANRAVLKLHITGFHLRRPGAVYIWDLDSQTTKVACGHSHSWGDRGSGSFVSLLPRSIRDGELTLDCNIQFRQPASPHLKEFLVQLGEDPPSPTLFRVAPLARHLVY